MKYGNSNKRLRFCGKMRNVGKEVEILTILVVLN